MKKPHSNILNRLFVSSLSLSLSLLLILSPAKSFSQIVTGYGNAKALAKWVASRGDGGDHDEDSGKGPDSTSRITTSTLYYDSVNSWFGVHTSTPMAPMHVIGRSVFEGESPIDSTWDYNRLYIGNPQYLEINDSKTIGYLGYNIYRGDDYSWYREGDQVNNGSSLILGNTRGELLFATFPSSGGAGPNPVPDTTALAELKMILTDKGSLGLGTMTPDAQLEIIHSDNTKQALILNQRSEDMLTNELRFCRNDSLKWAVGTHLNDTCPNSFFIWNHARSSTELFIAANGMVGINTEWPSAWLDVNGSFEAQRVGIGTNPPPADSSWKLFVEGGIKAREVKVTANSFADYVFGQDHSRLSIRELEDYIQTNKKLPGIPSAEEVDASGGINLGEMHVKLLEKIEEQALYIIDLQKQIDELKTMIGTNGEGRQ